MTITGCCCDAEDDAENVDETVLTTKHDIRQPTRPPMRIETLVMIALRQVHFFLESRCRAASSLRG
jgi:hypothetical protein